MHTIRPALNLFLLVGSLGGALPLGSIRAQESGALKGIVSTAEKKPLPQARVRVVGTRLAAVADTDGTFRIASLPPGSQSIEVRLLGYASVIMPVEIETGQTTTLEAVLVTAPMSLATVEVTGDTLIVPAMAGFLERKSHGNGRYFTREDIKRMQARLFTDILRRVPGMQMQSVRGGNNNSYTVQTGRSAEGVQGGRQCPVLFYMNGMPFPMTTDAVINSFIDPEEVEAVEVYAGASQIPPQFNSTGYTARCGVVVIWTLNGREPRPSN
jgi:iron complex outermembrane receptor protein